MAVDLRPGSKTYGRWYGLELSGENKKQLLIPRGFAHGFLVLSDTARLCYKCDNFYCAADEGGLAWNDPQVGVRWPQLDGTPLILSDKDRQWPFLQQLSAR